jgi:catechol 2,3-dioxygenase-like lactoylglutathione lyase family enzyme
MILRVKNLEQSVEWYVNAFGLKPSYRDVQYHLVELTGPTHQRIMLRELSDSHDVQPTHLYSGYVVFLTPDVEAAHAYFTGRGEPVGAVEEYAGVRLFWVTDPDGHRLCVLQFVIEWGS